MQQYPQDEQHLENWKQPQKSQYLQNTQQSFPQNPQQLSAQNLPPSYPQNPSQPSAQNFQRPYTQNLPQPPAQNVQQPYPQTGQGYQYNFSEKQMRRYFFKPARIWMWLIVVGAISFFFGIVVGSVIGAATGGAGSGVGTPFFIFGLIFFAIGGIPLAIHYTQRPNDEQYAAWVAERSQPLYHTAIKRLHIDVESQRPTIVEVEGGISSLVQLTKKFPEKEIIVKRLSNGLRHYSINTALHIFLTKNEIAIYSGYINALAQQERFEDAVRYYYQDIIAVSTSGPIFLHNDGTAIKEIQMQGFLVRANNGDVVGTDYATKVILRDGEKKVTLEGVDKVVPALLHFLKDHKMSAIEANVTSNNLL